MEEKNSQLNVENKIGYTAYTEDTSAEQIEVKGIDTRGRQVLTILSVLSTLICIIAIIPLIVSIIGYRKREKNSQTEEEKMQNKKKKRKCIIAIIIVIMILGINFIYGEITSYTYKPIIYLYPEETTQLTVTLGKPENITCSYPKYDNDGWQVIANPNGDLEDVKTGRKLYALYWEGINNNNANLKEGFVVKSEDTISFLEEKLAVLGLNERESEEFIVYWLPKLQENKYNLIRFATKEEIDEDMPLQFSKQPDTVIRVLMQYKGLNNYKEIPEQKLETPERKGFVAVEWGGTEIK